MIIFLYVGLDNTLLKLTLLVPFFTFEKYLALRTFKVTHMGYIIYLLDSTAITTKYFLETSGDEYFLFIFL